MHIAQRFKVLTKSRNQLRDNPLKIFRRSFDRFESPAWAGRIGRLWWKMALGFGSGQFGTENILDSFVGPCTQGSSQNSKFGENFDCQDFQRFALGNFDLDWSGSLGNRHPPGYFCKYRLCSN